MKLKRIYTFLMALGIVLMLSLTASGANQGGVRVLIDGEELDTSAAYISHDGTTMVSLRAMAEALAVADTHLRAHEPGRNLV